jgi:hypothetical protein
MRDQVYRTLHFQHQEESSDSTVTMETPFGSEEISEQDDDQQELQLPYATAQCHSLTVHLDPAEIERWFQGYLQDTHFSKVAQTLQTEENLLNP